jgi:hypothetical protein
VCAAGVEDLGFYGVPGHGRGCSSSTILKEWMKCLCLTEAGNLTLVILYATLSAAWYNANIVLLWKWVASASINTLEVH